ncbi:hypothetical protein Avbf_16401, partial [Armadillidium vulgare]
MDEVVEVTGENLNLVSQDTNNSSYSAQVVEDIVPSIAGVSYSPVTEHEDQIPARSCLKQNSSRFSEYTEGIGTDYDSDDTYSYEESNSATLSDGNFDLRSTFHSLNSLNDGNFASQSSPLSSPDNYPLAMKMMFNYEAESNAPAILTAMYKEMIPAKSVELDDVSALWKD